MLATLARALPEDERIYEPKWDGFRCLAFRDGADVVLTSRNHRPFGRYFPEVVEALLRLPTERFVLDGEIVVVGPQGFDFAALMLRLHPPASRVNRLREETPASFVAFDLLATDDRDVRCLPLSERRALLEAMLTSPPSPVTLTPAMMDRTRAERWLERFTGNGIDGVVAKDPHSPYETGRRSRSWIKVKRERTADCVVGGFRWADGPNTLVASLLLGLYDPAGELRHVGVTASFTRSRRRELEAELKPFVTSLAGHPWEHGFALERGPMGRLRGAAGAWDPRTMTQDWVPLRPELVCEVAYDQVDPSGRWRHPTRFCHWRPDRDPRSCTTDQLVDADAPPVDMNQLR